MFYDINSSLTFLYANGLNSMKSNIAVFKKKTFIYFIQTLFKSKNKIYNNPFTFYV